MKKQFLGLVLLSLFFKLVLPAFGQISDDEIELKVKTLLAEMTLEEKLGQMSQSGNVQRTPREELKAQTRSGRWGSFLNAGKLEDKLELQRVAVEESRLGIPLIFGRDVIHGYRTVFPIPLGQSASWNPDLIMKAASIAAKEAAAMGIHWTFAPMIDITRDPRWGRIAETCGEDPFLTSVLGSAMVRGFQGNSLSHPDTIAACAKHLVGYGAAEAGKDYNSTWIPEGLLRDVFLRPFKAAREAGVATMMSAFNDINGVPASGNLFTLRQVLRNEWNFDGFVVSDYNSMIEMMNHGYASDLQDVALKALQAGVDMEMVSDAYFGHLRSLVGRGSVDVRLIDEAVKNVLRIKFSLGLFDDPYPDKGKQAVILTDEHLKVAQALATQSVVLLKNHGETLPLSASLGKVAVIGPLANSPADQMGCWTMDGRAEDVQTPLAAIRKTLSKDRVLYAPGLETSRTNDPSGIRQAYEAAAGSEAVILFLGEERILSGEAKCRAFLNLPGLQEELVSEVVKAGKPTIAVIMAGRPLTFQNVTEKVQSVLYAWHPGTMGGPAIADLIFGKTSPTGKLTATFPRTVGQIPIYYAHKNTGRPPSPEDRGKPMGTPLDPKGYTAKYLDVDFTPEYPFGFGLSYTKFEYSDLKLSHASMKIDEEITATVVLKNVGRAWSEEIVQLYIRDLVASLTRPVKELRGFQRIGLRPGQSKKVTFTIRPDDLKFHNHEMQYVLEPGQFHVWVGPNSAEGLTEEFVVTDL